MEFCCPIFRLVFVRFCCQLCSGMHSIFGHAPKLNAAAACGCLMIKDFASTDGSKLLPYINWLSCSPVKLTKYCLTLTLLLMTVGTNEPDAWWLWWRLLWPGSHCLAKMFSEWPGISTQSRQNATLYIAFKKASLTGIGHGTVHRVQLSDLLAHFMFGWD